MRTKRHAGAVTALGALALALCASCDLVAGIGEYCVEGKDPGCGTGGNAGTGGAGGATTTSTGGGETTTASTGGGGTTTTSTGGGGAGGSPACTPPATQDCYTGPPGTKDVGICKGGTQTCLPNGVWGSCDGEAPPGVETCASTDDEDCDNKECAIWSKVFGDADDQSPLDIVADHDGNVIVLGFFKGNVTLAGKTFSAGASNNLLLLKFAPDGDLLWGVSLGDDADQSSGVLAVDPSNNVVLAGHFKGQIDFGSGNVLTNTTAATTDIFLVKLDPQGKHVWSHSYGDLAEQEVYDVAVDSLGDIALVGAFKGTVSLGKGDLVSPGSGHDVLVAKIASNGVTAWSKQYGDTSTQFGRRVAIGSNDSIYVLGSFGGTIDFGDGGQTDSTAGGADLFLAKLKSSDGGLLSKLILPQSSVVVPTGLAVDPDDHVIVTADIQGSANLGGVTYNASGGGDVCVAEYGVSWQLLWSHQFGGASPNDFSSVLSVGPGGEVGVAMRSDGGVDFGGGPLLSVGSSDIFVAKFNTTGQHIWSRRFGDQDAQTSPKLAAFDTGGIALTCKLSGTVNFGDGDHTSAGNDMAVVKLAP